MINCEQIYLRAYDSIGDAGQRLASYIEFCNTGRAECGKAACSDL